MTLSNFRTQAQGKITGQVTDNKNKIVEFATITLLQAKDSSLVKGALADANGTFEFEKIKFGSYLIAISQLGYQKFYTPKFTLSENPSIKLSNLILIEESKELNEVVVTAKKPLSNNR
jgi:ferritin-like metal-binding protein YciE